MNHPHNCAHGINMCVTHSNPKPQSEIRNSCPSEFPFFLKPHVHSSVQHIMKAMRHKVSRKRTRAAESQPLTLGSAFLALIGAVVFFLLLGAAASNRNHAGGVIIGVLALLISAVMCAFWYRTYQQRGITTKPRISFREIYVLYFGFSIEVGLIVHTMAGTTDAGCAAAALFLPPMLIGIIAGMDDTPNGRVLERKAVIKAKKELAPPDA